MKIFFLPGLICLITYPSVHLTRKLFRFQGCFSISKCAKDLISWAFTW